MGILSDEGNHYSLFLNITDHTAVSHLGVVRDADQTAGEGLALRKRLDQPIQYLHTL